MKKILVILSILFFTCFSVHVSAANTESIDTVTTKSKTIIEKLSKREKLKVIYIGGGVILTASCLAIYPIIKEKRK